MNPLTIQQSNEIHAILSDAQDKISLILDGKHVLLRIDEIQDKITKLLTPIQIIEIVANVYGVTSNQIRAKARGKNPIPDARMTSMTIISNEMQSMTLKNIAFYYSNRHHSSVCHAKQVYADLYATNPEFKSKADESIRLVNQAKMVFVPIK